jgi:diguanylate cyclase (GGDEF)-like protein
MSQLLDERQKTTSPLAKGGTRDPVAGDTMVASLPPAESQPGFDDPVAGHPGSGPAHSNHKVVEPTIQSLTLALARAEDHLSTALHHNQRMLANNAHLQSLVMERARDMEEIQRVANHDDLTGMPNRRMLPEHLRQALEHAEQQEQRVALVMLDLNGFRVVNDRFGHVAGDLVLRTIARRIAMNVSGFDTVCRYGGDEFVLILPDIDRSAALRTIEKIVQQIAAPCGVDGHAVSLTASAGLAMYPHDAKDAVQLLEAADASMYSHKPWFGIGRKPSISKRWFRAAKGGEKLSQASSAPVDEGSETESPVHAGGKTATFR